MTPANAAIVRANDTLFAPLVRWLLLAQFPGMGPWDCGCRECIISAAESNGIDPDRLVELCTTPDMLPDGGRDG